MFSIANVRPVAEIVYFRQIELIGDYQQRGFFWKPLAAIHLAERPLVTMAMNENEKGQKTVSIAMPFGLKGDDGLGSHVKPIGNISEKELK